MNGSSVYIGDLDDPAPGVAGDLWDREVPRPISRAFPEPREDGARLFHAWARRHGLPAMRTGFGEWVAIVGKHAIADFVSWCYDCDPVYTDADRMRSWRARADLVGQLAELRALVDGLDDRRRYALVASQA